MRCPACGETNDPAARFCAACGAELGRTCASCASPLPSGARFCPSCGHAVAEPVPAESRAPVTVLVAGVGGRRVLGDRLDELYVKDATAALLTAMRQAIESEQGTVEKVAGDTVTAAFGVSTAGDGATARALRAAVRMQSRVADANRSLEGERLALELRIGVNAGEIAGDAVGIAAKLERAAGPGEIFVSERAARGARGFSFGDAGTLGLTGKGTPVRVLRLLGETPRTARGVVLRAPLVGRAAEMNLLESIYERVKRERRPHLVTIYADPGVGKSRLVVEFFRHIAGSHPPPLILGGRCLPYGEGLTYWPLAEILKVLAASLDTDSPEVVSDKVRTLALGVLGPEVADDPARTAASLAYTVGVEHANAPARDLAPRQVRVDLHAAWRSFLSALAADRPVVATVADIHWADPALLDLLEELADRMSGPVLLICPARPELARRRGSWGGGRRNFSSITLERLGLEDADQLLRHLVGREDLPRDIREQILDRAAGNPLFIEEILRHLVDEGYLSRDAGRVRVAAPLDAVVMHDSVQGVLDARIGLLSPDERRILQAAAVVGRVFWTDPVARTTGESTERVSEILQELEARELVRERLSSSIGGDAEYMFTHILVRDLAYESIPRRERPLMHARIGRWIEEISAGREREVAEMIAHHFLEAFRGVEQDLRADAGLVEELRSNAFEYLTLGSLAAGTKLALSTAQRLAEQALVLASGPLERSRALEALGAACRDGYMGDLAWRYLREAVDQRLIATPEDHRAIARLCALALDVPTRWPGSLRTAPSEREATPYLQLGVEHESQLPPGDSEERIRLLTVRSFWPYGFPEQVNSDEELEVALAEGTRAADMAHRLGRSELESAALDGAAASVIACGWYGKAVPLVERRVRLTSLIRDPWEIGDICASAAWVHFLRGSFRDAAKWAAEGVARTEDDAPGPRIHCMSWGAMARFRLGNWRGFLAELHRIEELLGDRRTRPPVFASRPYVAAAVVHELQGNRAAADAYLTIVAEVERGERAGIAAFTAWIMLVNARRSQFDDAMKRFKRAENTGAGRMYRGVLLEARCDVIAEAGMWNAARGAVTDARRHAEEAGLIALPFTADRLDGLATIAAGNADEGIGLLERASAGFAAAGARWDQARTDLPLAEALLSAGRRDEARERLVGAAAVFEELSTIRERARANELLEKLNG